MGNKAYDQAKKIKAADLKPLVDGAICDAEVEKVLADFVKFCQDNGWRNFHDWLEAWSAFVASMPVEGGDYEIPN